MLPTTFRGENLLLLPYLCNWSTAPALNLSIDADITRSLGGIEARRAHAETLIAKFTCRLLMRRHEHDVFRAALRNLADKRVLMPFWPLAHRVSDGQIVYTDSAGNILTAPDGAIYTAGIAEVPPPPLRTGIWLTMEPDLSAWEVHETLLPATMKPGARALRVPLMLGILEKLPDPDALTPNLLSAKIEFRDTAPAGFDLRAVPLPSFEQAADQRFVFPLNPDWSESVSAGGVSYKIEHEEIGRGRAPATTYYPQNAARVLTATFATFTWDELARLAAFFHARGGSVENFWIDHPLDTNNTPLPLGEGPGGEGARQRMLARFAKPELNFSFTNGRIASAKIGFLETPDEHAAPEGEQPGETMGALKRPAQLFRFTRDYPGGAVVDRFTAYERAVNAAGEIFLPRHIEHGDITDSLEPEKTKVKITARAFEGNPLQLFSPNRLEVPLQVEILEALPDAAGAAPAPRLVFIGRCAKPAIKGAILTCEAQHLLADLQRDVPDMLMQAPCNYEFCGPACGLQQAGWTFTGALASRAGATITLAGLARAGAAALPVISAGWFAFGRVWFGAGAGFQTRTITDSTPLAGDRVTLTIAQPFDIEPAGEISLIPGCDGTPARCRVFANYQRFGGFPFIPVGNPSLRAIKKETKQGKK